MDLMFSCPRRLAPLRAAALITLALAAAISSAEALPHSIGGAVAAEAQLKTAQRPANRYHNLFHRSSVAKRSSGLSSKGFLKIVEAPPKLLEAREHGKIVLTCSASGNPAPEITWFKNGTPLVKKSARELMNEADYVGFAAESMAETKSRVEVDCMSQEDAGLYECVASNKKKTEMVAAEVRMASFESSSPACSPAPAGGRLTGRRRIAPRINQWISTFMQLLGTEAHLLCRTDHDEAKTTYWVGPDDQAIEESEKYRLLTNGDLLIRDLAFSDMGMFKCIVRNDFGEDMKETFVYPHAG